MSPGTLGDFGARPCKVIPPRHLAHLYTYISICAYKHEHSVPRGTLCYFLPPAATLLAEDFYARTLNDLRLHALSCSPSGRAHSSGVPSAPSIRRSSFNNLRNGSR